MEPNQNNSQRPASRIWDVFAVTLSSVCMLHCLGLPLLAALLPIASQFGGGEAVHIAMVVLAIPITLWVVVTEYRSGRNGYFIGTAITGLALMIAAIVIPVLEAHETAVTVVGGSMLAGAHLWRWFQHQTGSQKLSSATETDD